jgi:hypothetical protein
MIVFIGNDQCKFLDINRKYKTKGKLPSSIAKHREIIIVHFMFLWVNAVVLQEKAIYVNGNKITVSAFVPYNFYL